MPAATAHRSALRGLPVDQQTIPALLELRAQTSAARPMLSVDGRTLSFAEVRDAAVEQGDRVASLYDNRFELVELILGCAWLGAVAVPLNTAMRGDQLSHALS